MNKQTNISIKRLFNQAIRAHNARTISVTYDGIIFRASALPSPSQAQERAIAAGAIKDGMTIDQVTDVLNQWADRPLASASGETFIEAVEALAKTETR